jgi:hypothetical protein
MSKAAELANLIGNINAGGGGVNRNLIINGAMNVSQRGTSFTTVTNGTYTLDRFNYRKTNDGEVTITQDSSAPDGFSNSLKVDVTTADTSIGASQLALLEYNVEAQDLQSLAFGTSSAKNITLSFYVKSNKTGTYAVNIQQSDNSSKQAVLNYTINSANTWERKSLTFTGDTSGVINDDNGVGFAVYWIFAVGSNFTSGSASATFQTFADGNLGAGQAVNLLDSTSNDWFLTGVQLEIGQNPTEFEHEPFERTLAMCQRYYHLVASGSTKMMGMGDMYTTSQLNCIMHFPVQMRAIPSLDATSGTNYYTAYGANSQTNMTNAWNLFAMTNNVASVYAAPTASVTAGSAMRVFANNSSASIAFDAEL